MAHTLEIPDKIAAHRESVAERLAILHEDTRATLEDAVAIDDDKRFAWQEKSLALAAGHIDLETADYLYRTIGEIGSVGNGGWPEGVGLVDKIVARGLMARIAEARIAEAACMAETAETRG